MLIYIKNMVCERCKMVIRKVLAELDLPYIRVEPGLIELSQPLSIKQKQALSEGLNNWDLSIIESQNEVLVERIKNSIINIIHNGSEFSNLKISRFLSSHLNYSYTYLSNLFSRETGMCLRDYVIAQKIEKAKYMLITEQLTLSEIAWRLNYSSVAHLSKQFTMVTGFNPSQFKRDHSIPLIPRAKIGLQVAV